MKKKKQHNQAKPNWVVIGVVVGAILIFFGAIALAGSGGSKNIELAKCLTEKGATFYGAHWCGHCGEQKRLIGKKAMEHINYIECAAGGPKDIPPSTALCKEKNIQGYPTWIFADDSRLTNVQTLDRLASKTGCGQFLQ